MLLINISRQGKNILWQVADKNVTKTDPIILKITGI